jgi:hypothetical protein
VALLLDSDYERLRDASIVVEESEPNRYLIFRGVKPQGLKYTVDECDVLVVIPANYPQAGNDMFWTAPQLFRADGKAIPQVNGPGGDSRIWNGREFCRWSRHWSDPSPGVWRPGKDDVISIYRRITWAFENPDCS